MASEAASNLAERKSIGMQMANTDSFVKSYLGVASHEAPFA
jgi:hypothetical protein